MANPSWCKNVTGKEHLERNDFIIEKQKAELQRIDAAKRHKEQQVELAEQELKQVKSEIRTDKLKSVATDAATAIASGVGSLFGSGKLKELEHNNLTAPWDDRLSCLKHPQIGYFKDTEINSSPIVLSADTTVAVYWIALGKGTSPKRRITDL